MKRHLILIYTVILAFTSAIAKSVAYPEVSFAHHSNTSKSSSAESKNPSTNKDVSTGNSISIDRSIVDSIFKDPQLNILLHEALDNNSDIRIAALNIEQAKAMLKSAKLNYLPSFSLSPSGTVSKVQDGTSVKTYSLPLTMEWELSLGGKQSGEKQMAKATLQQTEDRLKYEQINLISDVANAYYTLIMLDRQCYITENSISNQKATLKAICAFKDVGKMNELAVNQTKSALYATITSLEDLHLQISKVETALSLLLNREISSNKIIRAEWDNVASISINPEIPVDLSLLSSRPDVKGAEQEIALACGNLKVARSAFYPSLKISADGGWTNNIGEIVNPGKILLNMIGSLTQPIFSQGTIKSQAKVAETQLRQAEISFEKTLLKAGGEVKDALSECQSVSLKRESRTKEVEASNKAWEDSQSLLQFSQSITYLDVLTAEASLLSAQLDETADWMEHQQSLINLYKALCITDSSQYQRYRYR